MSKIKSQPYRHMLLLIYWAVYGLFFLYFERIRVCDYHAVECGFDSMIPFIPAFIIPYFFWFVYLIGMLVYTFFYDVPAFKKYMWYIIFTYTCTIVIYFVYPTKQELRPVLDETATGFARVVSGLYVFDTNTNVCPSIHVLGSMAVFFTSLECKKLQNTFVKLAFFIMAVLISISTVFLKQHSVIDLVLAVIFGIACYFPVFGKNRIAKKLSEL